MTENNADPSFPLDGSYSLFGGESVSVRVERGLAIFVGPNGTGKTRALRSIKPGLHTLVSPLGLKVRFLAAGRSSPLEPFRSAVNHPGSITNGTVYLGNASNRPHWNDYESVTGDFLAIEQRPDLQLKVQARLQSFLSRSLQLSWSQGGLEINLIGSDGSSYPANWEASGILQLVPLLAAIYHDEIGALLIDEPEISLHPQYQAFIRDELFTVAGDPRHEKGKKFVVLATHAPIMLNVRQAPDLSRVVFFNVRRQAPRQLSPASPELKNRKLKALVSRLSATHRLAFFAQNVLLVEGASDEIILEQLAACLHLPLMAANTQIVPVNGKGEFAEAVKLFELIGKRVTVLADLDGLVDNNALVNHFGRRPESIKAAEAAGHRNLAALDARLRTELAQAVADHWAAVADIAEKHPYWMSVQPEKRDELAKKRALLAVLLCGPIDDLHRRAPNAGFSGLRMRFSALIELLAVSGCLFLQRGTIESYYASPPDPGAKVEAAAAEAMLFIGKSALALEAAYPEGLRVLRLAAQRPKVDENTMLRERLGALIGATFQTLETSTDNVSIGARAADVLGAYASIFEVKNASTETEKRLSIAIRSPLFQRDGFPFEISINDNLSGVLSQRLPATN